MHKVLKNDTSDYVLNFLNVIAELINLFKMTFKQTTLITATHSNKTSEWGFQEKWETEKEDWKQVIKRLRFSEETADPKKRQMKENWKFGSEKRLKRIMDKRRLKTQ